MDAPERLARRSDASVGGPARIEPDALQAEDGAVGVPTGVFARTGGDQRRKPAKAVAIAVAKLRVKAQCQETTIVNAILVILSAKGVEVLPYAPTGRSNRRRRAAASGLRPAPCNNHRRDPPVRSGRDSVPMHARDGRVPDRNRGKSQRSRGPMESELTINCAGIRTGSLDGNAQWVGFDRYPPQDLVLLALKTTIYWGISSGWTKRRRQKRHPSAASFVSTEVAYSAPFRPRSWPLWKRGLISQSAGTLI